jgi:hypothetical protein
MNIHRNAAAIVSHRNGSIDVDYYLNSCAKSGEMFIDGIIEYLKHQVVQTSLVGISYEHPRPFSDRLKTFQFVDLSGVVFLRCPDSSRAAARWLFDRNFFLNLRHKSGPKRPW